MPGRDAVTLAELNASRAPEGFDTFQERDGALDRDVYTPSGVIPVETFFLVSELGGQLLGEDGSLLTTEDSP